MSAFPIGLILDTVLVVLLVGTLGYAFVLNKALGRLRQDRAEMEALIVDINAAVQRSEAAIQGLRDAAGSIQGEMDSATQAAVTTLDELKLVTGSGEKLADRIERATTGIGRSLEPRALSRDEMEAAAQNTRSQDGGARKLMQEAIKAAKASGFDVASDTEKAPEKAPVIKSQSLAGRRRSRAEEELYNAMSSKGQKAS